mmetsp:Transcript_5902/g.12420  ORF Transcript_5902/g.12420 Transcript_5902/m.12420 type:complete len:242 (-) Transcript_5902:283-1008(-)
MGRDGFFCQPQFWTWRTVLGVSQLPHRKPVCLSAQEKSPHGAAAHTGQRILGGPPTSTDGILPAFLGHRRGSPGAPTGALLVLFLQEAGWVHDKRVRAFPGPNRPERRVLGISVRGRDKPGGRVFGTRDRRRGPHLFEVFPGGTDPDGLAGGHHRHPLWRGCHHGLLPAPGWLAPVELLRNRRYQKQQKDGFARPPGLGFFQQRQLSARELGALPGNREVDVVERQTNRRCGLQKPKRSER